MPKKGEVLNNAPSPAITERKQAEQVLRESEEKFRTIFENANDSIIYLDKYGRIIDINRSTEDIFGYKREEVQGKSFTKLSIFSLKDLPRMARLFADAFRSAPIHLMELEIKRKDSSPVIIEASTELVRKDGKVEGMLVIARDLTERKRMEQALKESEEKFRTFMETASDLMHIADKDGNLTYVNESMARSFGYSKQEMVGKHITQLLSKEALEKDFKPNWDKFITNGEIALDTTFATKDGKDIYGEIKVVAIYDSDGKYAGSRAVFRDLTERKREEEALRHAERDWRNSFNSLEDVMIIIDKDYNIENINDNGLILLGMSKEEVIGRKCYQVVGDRETPSEDCPALLAARTKRVESVDRYEERFGKYFSIKTSPVFDEKGEIVKFIDLRRDITERKLMERELQEKNEQLDAQNEELRSQSEELRSQSEELMAQQQELIEKTREVEKANQLKSDFLANMSHELRTPLNVIIGFSQLMIDEVPGKINEEQRQCLNDILNSSKHLLNLINDVLDLSKIESGKVELKLENVALTEIIESVTRTMMPILTPRKQSLDIEIEEGLPPVYADEGKLGQVLLNLVDNATKFTPDGGNLKIEAARDSDWCQVSVIDNGIGIKKDDQGRIFEPFSQLDNPLTVEKAGTGLGLALVKQIVERYGGRIWVESEYGKGSRFTFTMPLATSS